MSYSMKILQRIIIIGLENEMKLKGIANYYIKVSKVRCISRVPKHTVSFNIIKIQVSMYKA